jgi:hypothetical protein
MLKLSHITDKSVNELVNTIIASVDNIELTETVKLDIKPESRKTEKITMKKTCNWVTKL